MAVDPRLERLPEHEGPAFRTWQIIMQTTMGSVIPQPSPSGFQFNNNRKPLIAPGEDFIALNQGESDKDFTDNNDDKSTRKKEGNKQQQKAVGDDTTKVLTPWKTVDHYPENALGLHREITDFFNYMSPLPEEEQMRQNVVDRITALILNIWPGAKVEVFGSFRTKLYLPTSDIDLAVFGKWEKLPLFTLEKELINNDVADASTIKVLDKASVPIIKLTDKLSKIRVDISFNVESSIKSAEMIKSYIEEFKILPTLFITLKHFLLQRDLNEVFTGGISSYCLMLLTISFLQRHPRIDVRKSKANLGVLLMEFFELYGRNFNYQRIGVKLRDNGAYRSKEELAKELGDGVFLPLLCIEDPVTLSCDIGRSSYGILRVKEAFEYAFNVVDIALRKKHYFKVNPNSTYLSRIVSVPKDLCEYRNWVKTSYKSTLFIPKTKTIFQTIPSPLYAAAGFASSNNGRPALLPTPLSPFSPRISMVTSPFSPYPATTNSMQYSPVRFFDSPLIIPNESNDTHINSLPLKSPAADVTNQVRYVVPSNSYNQHTLIQDRTQTPVFNPSTQNLVHSPVKTLPVASSNINPFFTSSSHHHLNNVLTSLKHQRHNNTLYSKPKHNISYSSKRVNSERSSHKNSPRTSPKLGNRDIVEKDNKKVEEAPKLDTLSKETSPIASKYIEVIRIDDSVINDESVIEVLSDTNTNVILISDED